MTDGIPYVTTDVDVTTQLIQIMTAGPGDNAGYTVNNVISGTSADRLSGIADWAQVLSGPVGALGQGAAASIIANIAAQQKAGALAAGATAQGAAAAGKDAADAATLGVSAATAGVAAVIVLIIAAVLQGLGGDGSTSTESQQLMDLMTGIGDDVRANYWFSKQAAINNYWDPPGGDGPSNYLDNLASQGTGGNLVMRDVANWHNASISFMKALTTDTNAAQYWEVTSDEPGYVPQQEGLEPPDSWWAAYIRGMWPYASWYGHFPARLNAQGVGRTARELLDPTSMLPVLALAIQSNLTLESMAHIVDSSQTTLGEFLQEFGHLYTNPGGFLDVFYTQYSRAVTGIVMTDLPSEYDILGLLYGAATHAGVYASPDTSPDQPTSQSWGASIRLRQDIIVPAYSGDGYSWNGLLGAAAVYPQYGWYATPNSDDPQGWPGDPFGPDAYRESVFILKSLFAPEYIVSLPSSPSGADIMQQWWRASILFNAGGSTYVSMHSLQDWVIPWLQNRVIFARMARWKAIYLIDSYDKIWAMLQSLQQILLQVPNPAPRIVPPAMTFQDNTGTTYMANGNWSARELISVVKVSNSLLAGNVMDPAQPFIWAPASSASSQPVTGHSVVALAQLLSNVQFGDWGGPPKYQQGEGPSKPFSLRLLVLAVAEGGILAGYSGN